MSVQSLLPWLMLAIVASIAGMVIAAAGSDGVTHLLAAALFGSVLLAAALAVNLPYWRSEAEPGPPPAVITQAHRNAQLHALAYAWGGAAMAADYTLSQLRWRHDWQYALAMIIASLICLAYAVRIARPGTGLAAPGMLRYAAMAGVLEGLGAALGIAHLFASGKIWTFGGDWAANHIFLVGAIVLVGLSAIALESYRRTMPLTA